MVTRRCQFGSAEKAPQAWRLAAVRAAAGGRPAAAATGRRASPCGDRPRKDEARMTVARCCTHSLSDVAGARSAARAQHELETPSSLSRNFVQGFWKGRRRCGPPGAGGELAANQEGGRIANRVKENERAFRSGMDRMTVSGAGPTSWQGNIGNEASGSDRPTVPRGLERALLAAIVENSDDAIASKDLVVSSPAGTTLPSAYSAMPPRRSSAGISPCWLPPAARTRCR